MAEKPEHYTLDDGSERWELDGQLHREDGPALILPDGEQRWYQYGQLHREDGPAVILANGTQKWFVDGQLHRDDGPAVDKGLDLGDWYLRGRHLNAEEVDVFRSSQAFNVAARELKEGSTEPIRAMKPLTFGRR